MQEYEKYISSDGTIKNVKELNTEYLINALAKCNRLIYETKTQEDFFKYHDNIENISNELMKRRKEYYENNLEIEVI